MLASTALRIQFSAMMMIPSVQLAILAAYVAFGVSVCAAIASYMAPASYATVLSATMAILAAPSLAFGVGYTYVCEIVYRPDPWRPVTCVRIALVAAAAALAYFFALSVGTAIVLAAATTFIPIPITVERGSGRS